MRVDEFIVETLKEASVLKTIAWQVVAFKTAFKRRPNLVEVSRLLKPAVCKELILDHGMSPDAAVVEPLWLDDVPIIFTKLEEGTFVEVQGSKGRALVVL
jgi:hypothetical protein